jgi:pilus assembly protein CpaC
MHELKVQDEGLRDMIRNSHFLKSAKGSARTTTQSRESSAAPSALREFLKKCAQCCAVVGALGVGGLLGQTAENLSLTLGKSLVIEYPSDVREIKIGDTAVVDGSPVTTREIVLDGKGVGTTTMIVWNKTGQRTFYNVNVELNLEPLRRILKESFPNETIDVHSARDTVTLTGIVSNKDVAERATAMAAAQSKTVVNNLLLRGDPNADKQILLRVRFAELDREKELQFGVNLLAAPGNNMVGATTGQFNSGSVTGTFTVPPQNAGSTTTSSGSSSSAAGGSATGGTTSSAIGNAVTYSISQALNLFALDPKLNLGAFIKALQNENILQILAEPNLVTTNGKEANFLVGGQFPVPVVQGGATAGAVTVQFKEYGIKLRFLPLITPTGTIRMHLYQDVSTLDYTNAAVLNGFTIPATSNRTTETDVELGEGQSFVVAGLINNQETNTLSKVPGLANIPILGALFKSKDDKVQRTELILVVTPEITMPLGPSDPRPDIYMPKDFMKKLDPKDVPQTTTTKKGSKSAN